MRALGFALILAGVGLFAGSLLLGWQQSARGAEVPPEVVRLERALARPGLLGLATVDVATLVELAGEAAAGEPTEEQSLRGELARAGIDLERDVSHATFALLAQEEGEARIALALFGHFDPAAIERALAEHPNLDLLPAGPEDPQGVLRFERIDPETCEQTGPFALHVDARRVLVANAELIGPILEGAPAAGEADGALRDLDRFQAFRAGQLVSAAVFVPAELPRTDNLLLAMAAGGAARQVAGFRAFYAGATPQLVPPGLAVDALFEGDDAAFAADKARAWQDALDGFGERLAEKLPTLAALLDALELSAEGPELHARLRLARSDLERLRELPGELGASLFGAGMLLGGGQQAGTEQLDESPLAFEPEVSGASLAAYDPDVPFAGAVEQTAGPVGVRVAAIRLGDSPSRSEIELEAFATGVPNLGDRGERLAIEVSSVESVGGQELLAEEHCGSPRNGDPAPLTTSFGGGVRTGSKRLRLRDGAMPREVDRIVGSASLRLPVRTEAVRLPAHSGEAVERAGTRVEITGAQGGSFSYRVTGDEERLLHLRGLNASGKPLARRSASSGASLFGSGSSGSLQLAGVVEQVEAVFAVEEEELRFPFELTRIRPGTDGEHLARGGPDPGAKALPAIAGRFEDWLDGLAGGLATAVERVVDGTDRPMATARTGPFLVSLESIFPFGGLMPRLEVQAPEIPGVADNPTAVLVRLEELRMKDGAVHTGEWSQVLSLGKGFGRPGLVGSAELQTGSPGSGDDVESLHGSVSIRLPRQVAARRLEGTDLGASLDAPDLDVRLVELGRDRFTLRAEQGADRVLGARAWNAFGDELWVPRSDTSSRPDGAVDLTFQVMGVPDAIEVRYATRLVHAEYPFTLATGRNQLASLDR